MKKIIGNSVMILSTACALYVGVWLMLISPIIEVCQAYDAGTLTGLMIGIAIIKCLFSGVVSSVIGYFGILFGAFIKL